MELTEIEVTWQELHCVTTRSSAFAWGPRDAPRLLKSFQLLYNYAKNPSEKGLQRASDLEGHSRSMELSLFDKMAYITSC